ncbi:MAG: cation-translocating P-type ATPase [Desulfamplus sp.]|nr:cation-translocating P-type ATPase [Desulfamplus sp.]
MKSLTIEHHISWRSRIKVLALKNNKQLAEQIAEVLVDIPEISFAEVRLETGSIIILHESSPIVLESIREIVKKEFPDIFKLENSDFGSACSVKAKKYLKKDAKKDDCLACSKESHVPAPILAVSGVYMFTLWIGRLFFRRTPVVFSGIGKIFNLPAVASTLLSIPILKEGLENLSKNRRLNMDLLIVSASYLSIFMGEPVTAMVVVWLINFSAWIENRTQEKTRKAVRAMLKQENREVWILKDEIEVSINVSELQKGDLLSLRMGTSVPADGTVVRGECLMNESTLTGESLPAFKTEGDKVFAGTTVEMGHIFVRADSVGEDTRLASIIRLIENGAGALSSVQLSAQKFSDAVVPISLCLSLGVFFLTQSISRALSMLIIACPCGVSLSTPTAIMAAMGSAARQGILIKGGRYLEVAGQIDTLCFDKTGTLTKGSPRVSRVVTLDEEFEPIRILQLAASSQIHWKHPMTLAVLEKIREIEIEIPKHEETELIIGHGVRAKINGDEVLVGSHHFMEDYEVDHEMGHFEEERILNRGESVLFVAFNRRLIGLIGIEDHLKEKAREVLYALKGLGIEHLAMITGDHERHAQSIAKELPIDIVLSQQSPEDKAAWIASWKEKYPEKIVGMVGDGINDTPAFSHADLSFAMGDTGADAAIEHADIVLRRGDLALVARSADLGQRTLSVIRQNYGISVGLNLAGVLLAGFGWLSPMTGALLHNLITVGVVGNSAKLLFYHTEIEELAKKGEYFN